MMTFNNLVGFTQENYDSAVEQYLGKQKRIFEPYMVEKTIPMGFESVHVPRLVENNDEGHTAVRGEAVQLDDLQFTKRIFMRRARNFKAFEVDTFYDKINQTFDPTSEIVTVNAQKIVKHVNKLFVANFEAPVQQLEGIDSSGNLLTVTKTFLAGNVIPSNHVASGTPVVSGLTVAKLEELIERMEASELTGEDLEEEDSQICLIVSEAQLNNLMQDERASKADYAHFFVYKDNKLVSYRGIKFLVFPRHIPSAVVSGDTIERLYAWTRKAFVHSGLYTENKIAKSSPAHGFADIIGTRCYYNTMRMWEERAYVIECKK